MVVFGHRDDNRHINRIDMLIKEAFLLESEITLPHLSAGQVLFAHLLTSLGDSTREMVSHFLGPFPRKTFTMIGK